MAFSLLHSFLFIAIIVVIRCVIAKPIDSDTFVGDKFTIIEHCYLDGAEMDTERNMITLMAGPKISGNIVIYSAISTGDIGYRVVAWNPAENPEISRDAISALEKVKQEYAAEKKTGFGLVFGEDILPYKGCVSVLIQRNQAEGGANSHPHSQAQARTTSQFHRHADSSSAFPNPLIPDTAAMIDRLKHRQNQLECCDCLDCFINSQAHADPNASPSTRRGSRQF